MIDIYELFLKHRISIDSRNTNNCIFFALKGNRDGNTFVKDAFDNRAAYAVIDNPLYLTDKCILVDDVLKTLQELASYHRDTLNIPIIAITGLNGKTTTKELITTLLSDMNVSSTVGNLNNHIGVPLTLLSIPSSSRIAVIEMGANHKGEIDFLCNIAKPTHGLITNIGDAHSEGFGGIEGIKIGKGELYNYLNKTGGIIFANKDEVLIKMLNGRDYIPEEDVKLIQSSPLLFEYENNIYNTNLSGSYNINNISIAISVAKFFGVKDIDLTKYYPHNRSEIKKTVSNTLIVDCYNANTTSVSNAINSFEGNVIILGDMFELENPLTQHEFIIQKALSKCECVIFIGKYFYTFKDVYNGLYFECVDDFDLDISNSTILLKGSRGMMLEKLIEVL